MHWKDLLLNFKTVILLRNTFWCELVTYYNIIESVRKSKYMQKLYVFMGRSAFTETEHKTRTTEYQPHRHLSPLLLTHAVVYVPALIHFLMKYDSPKYNLILKWMQSDKWVVWTCHHVKCASLLSLSLSYKPLTPTWNCTPLWLCPPLVSGWIQPFAHRLLL